MKFPASPLWRWALIVWSAVVVICLVGAAGYWRLVANNDRSLQWTAADADGDGVGLIDDLDADGDGRDFPGDPDCDNDGVADAEQAVLYGRSMAGIPTDFLMGKYFDVLGRVGRIVCVDVPLRSYLSAGCSFPALLKQSAALHPGWFAIDSGNDPGNPFFYRRVRNYRALFEHHPGLTRDEMPRAGDWVFYGDHHVALVIDADQAGNYRVMEAYSNRTAAADGKEVEEIWGPPNFFGRVRPSASR